MDAGMRLRLDALGIRVREEPVLRLEGRDGRLERIVFEGGAVEPRRALFFTTGQRQASELPARLGCRFTREGAVATGKCEATNVPGLYVCGDASKEAQFVVVAAAEGAEAGMAINKALLEESSPTLCQAGGRQHARQARCRSAGAGLPGTGCQCVSRRTKWSGVTVAVVTAGCRDNGVTSRPVRAPVSHGSSTANVPASVGPAYR
jgi:hypothetical protein